MRNTEIRRLQNELADRDAVIEALEADRIRYQGTFAIYCEAIAVGFIIANIDSAMPQTPSTRRRILPTMWATLTGSVGRTLS